MAQSPSTPNQPLGSLPWRGNIEPSSVKSLPRAVLQDTNDHHFFFPTISPRAIGAAFQAWTRSKTFAKS